MNRRDFIISAGLLNTVGGLANADDTVRSCGPPPKAKKHSRTGGESFAPLPLPVTPLRRTEKKRPPAPPALIGKVNLGTTRWITVEGKRQLICDWMTDPADMDTLLLWTNEKLGINYRCQAVDLNKFSFDPREMPVLYFTGHETLPKYDDKIIDNLLKFIKDGGFIVGDACCGSKDFVDSFRKFAVKLIGGGLTKLRIDHPVYSSYFKMSPGTDCVWEGYDIGCRTAIFFTKKDMSCGWDGHTHDGGNRFSIDEARQYGANLITYMLGTFQLGKFLSTKKVYHETTSPTRDDFVLCQLIHDGDWNPDPNAIHNLLKFAKDNTTMEVKFKVEYSQINEKIAIFPLLYMTGHRDFVLNEEELLMLRKYFKAGGMLLADACCGSQEFQMAFHREFNKIQHVNDTNKSPILNGIFDVSQVEYTPRVREDYGPKNTPELHTYRLYDKLAIVYSPFDLGCGWEQFPHAYGYGYKSEDALKIGTNVIAYALTH